MDGGGSTHTVTVTLRAIVEDERDDFFAMYEDYSRELEPFDPSHEPTDIIAYRAAVEDDLAYPDSGRELLWILVDGARAGFIVTRTLPDWLHEERVVASIAEFCVAPPYRRHGVGTAAVEALIAEHRRRGTTEVEASILRDNAAAQAFWARLGFGVHSIVTVRSL